MVFFSFLKILPVRFQRRPGFFVFLRSFGHSRKGFFPLLQGLFLCIEKECLFLQPDFSLLLFGLVFLKILPCTGKLLQCLFPEEIVPDLYPFGGSLFQTVHDLLHGFLILRAESVHPFRLFDHDLRPDEAVLQIKGLVLIIDAFRRDYQIGHLAHVGI